MDCEDICGFRGFRISSRYHELDLGIEDGEAQPPVYSPGGG